MPASDVIGSNTIDRSKLFYVKRYRAKACKANGLNRANDSIHNESELISCRIYIRQIYIYRHWTPNGASRKHTIPTRICKSGIVNVNVRALTIIR